MPIPDLSTPSTITMNIFINKYAGTEKAFTCINDIQPFTKEIRFFTQLSWQQMPISKLNTSQEQIGCLLFSTKEKESGINYEDYLTNKPSTIILHIPANEKKTPVFTEFEKQGYRIYREWDELAYLYLPVSSIKIITADHLLGNQNTRKILEKSWRRIHKLSEDTKVDHILIDAKELLTPRRFDIAIKSHYARLWLADMAKSWREYAYYEHVLRITGPSQEITEYGTEKKGLDAFYENFHSLLQNHTEEEIPAVPVDSTLVAFDGSHRIAAAIATGRNIYVARIKSSSKSHATAAYFEGTEHGHPACPQEILDEAAIEYCRIKDTVAIALIFPTVMSEKIALQELGDVSEIIYHKNILLTPQAGGDLLKQVYLGHSWLDITQESHGFQIKKSACFPFTGTLRVVLLDNINPKNLRVTKEHIRAQYGLGNHSIHITDSVHETLRVARIVFNNNSLNLLRMGLGRSQDFHDKLFRYRAWLEENNINEEFVAVGGSATLALLGLREVRDLDFLYHGPQNNLPIGPKDIDCHNDSSEYYEESIADILGDPRLHCWYMGVKFCTPEIVIIMKKKRAENKDKKDVFLLRSKTKKITWMSKTLSSVYRISSSSYAYFRLLTRRLKNLLRSLYDIRNS